MALQVVPPNYDLEKLMQHVREGRTLYIAVYNGASPWLTPARLKSWEKAGLTTDHLIKPEGDGYRVKSGKKSVYVFKGQLLIQ